MRFARNQVFASPSAAAAVIVGRTANGRSDWKIPGFRSQESASATGKPKALIKPTETTCHKPAEQRGNITPPELFAVLADASGKSRTRWAPSLRVASGPSAFTIATGG